MRCCTTAVLTVLLMGSWAVAAPVVKGPTVTTSGGSVRIAFSVSEPTDVEVGVLGAAGKVVRHLAAGVLGGKNPPPAPLKAGLAQELTWDGKDDFGTPAAGGPFSVRVRAGLGVRFDRFIGGDPYVFGAINGLAADEDGDLYVMGYAGLLNQRQMTIRVFAPDGRYLREILPFPATLGEGAMKDVARWDPQRRTWRPRNVTNLNPSFYRGGSLTLVSASKANGVVLTDGTRMFTLTTGGAVRGERFITRTLWEKKHIPWGGVPNSGKGPICLAVRPDGKSVCLAGIFTSKTRYGHTMQPFFPPGRVFGMRLDEPDTMGEFVTIDVAHKGGVGGHWTKGLGYGFTPRGPLHGITFDARGNLYVCDREHDRIAVFDPAGKLINQTPVQHPDQVALDPTSDGMYVMRRDRKTYGAWFAELVKFARCGKDEKPVARYTFPPKVSSPRMALSVAGGKRRVWVSGVAGGVVALVDKGDAIELVETQYKRPQGVQLDWNRIATDYERDEIYVSDGATLVWRYDGKSGEGELLKKDGRPFYVNDLAVGYDGNLFVRVSGKWDGSAGEYSGPFWRLDRAMNPVPYRQTGTHVLSRYIYSRYGIGYAERGIGPAPDGRVYLSFMYKWVNYCVAGFDPQGKPLQGKYLKGKIAKGSKGYKPTSVLPAEMDSAIIGPITAANGGVRVDLAGNLYVGMWVWPKDAPVSAGFRKDRGYLATVGSVVKFSRDGGFVAATGNWGGSDQMIVVPATPGAEGIRVRSGQRGARFFDAFIEGATGIYPGLAPFSHDGFGGNSCCVCRVPRFDVDRYGRIAMPNAVTNSVRLVDNAGNLIREFGRYGNFDSQYVNPQGSAKGAVVSTPDIPLTWPTGTGFTKGHIYVNDTYSRRVVRTTVTYAAEAACRVK